MATTLEGAFEELRLQIQLDTGTAETRAKALAESILEVARTANVSAKEAGAMTAIYIKEFGELDASTKLILKSAQEYAVTLERIERSIKGGTQRAAVQQVKDSEKWLELKLIKEQEEAERLKVAAEQQSILTNEKQLALENAQTQALREQLMELQRIATADAKSISSQNIVNRDYAIPGGGSQADLATRKLMEAEHGLLSTSIPLTEAQKKLGQELKQLEPAAKTAHKGLFSLSNFLRTAFGTLTAIGIFTVLQTLQQFFTGALQAAEKFRGNLASLNFAEAILSQRGLDITRKELDDTISYIEAKFKYLSTLEVTGIVATVADMGAEFNLTKEQVTGLSEAVAFLQLKERAYGQEVSDVGSIVNAALDGRSNFFNKLGINITKTAIAEKAYAMGLAESGAQLTKEQSNQAAIALLIEQTAGKYDELLTAIEQVNPAMANQLKVSKELEDASLDVGNTALAVKDAWNELIAALIEGGTFDEVKIKIMDAITALADFIGLITDAYVASRELKDNIKELEGEFGNTESAISSWVGGPGQTLLTFLQLLFLGFTTVVGAIVTVLGILSEFFAFASGAKSYEEAGQAIGEHFSNGILNGIAIGLKPLVSGKNDPIANRLKEVMALFGQDISTPELPDTPTGSSNSPVLENQEDLQKALEKMNNEILEAQLKLAQDMEDAAIDLGRKLEDIAIEYAQKRADAERDYASKVTDINADYQNTIANIQAEQQQANQAARNDELQREAEFQEKMRQLKEKFLMDLEDALHSRDARQVLRLIKQYNLEKEQAEREFALQQENAQRDQALRNERFQQERAEAERKRKAALAEAQRDYQDKLAKLAADEAAERAAAELAYQRKKEDLEREMQNRLEIIAANLVAEFNLTQSGLDAIVALYRKYYEEVAAIYAAMNAMMAGQGNIGSTTTSGGGGKPGGGGSGGGSSGGAKPYKEGGIVVANKATRAVFGEAGPEIATFTPLGSQQGVDVNKVFSNLQGGDGGMSGALGIEVVLSPDLEARIINNTLGQTANIIAKVRRSK